MSKYLKNDLPASIVVFFVALPLCLGIALASGAPLFSGVIAGIVGGVVVGALSGSQIGVSGPAAGLAAIVLTAIGALGGFENFLLAVVLGGVIQLIFGILKAGIIEERQPDIIVLGKRKSAPFQLIGDNITQYVFNTYKGAIMIATDKNTLEPNKEIFLGLLNNLEPLVNLKFAEDLMAHTKSSLKSFKIVKKLGASEEIANPANIKTVEYVFEHNDSSIKNLSNYLTKSNINLLYLNRMKKQVDKVMVSDIKSLVNNLNVTLLVTAE